MATGGGAGGDVRNEDDLMRQSRELLAGDRLGSLATREKRTRPTTREREDLEEARARLHNPRSQEDLVARGTQLSEHVLGRALDLGSGGFLEERVEEVEHDRLSIKSEESENGPEIGDAVRHGRRAEDRVSGFVDVTKMSAASRRSAAPHIYNIFEQIFVDTDSGAHQRPAVPDLPAEVRASMRASGVNLDEELGLTGSRAEVVMTIDESWKQLTRGTGNPSGLEKQLVSDLAIALRVPKSRFQITGVKPSGMGSRAVAELVILPGSEGEPQAVEVAEALSLQAGTPQSMLASMTSTKRASNVRFREVQPAVAKAMQGGESGPYQALLRGGVVLDDRGIRPALSAYQSMAPTQLMQSSPKQGVSGGAGGLGAHQRDLETIRMVESARRRQEGFWVDVDRGLYQPVQSVHKYGTFRAPGRNKMPIWIWTLLIFGGTLMTALMCWLVYLKFYLAPKNAGTASAFPAEPTAEHAAPVAAEGHGSEADTLARAAMAAAAHATAAAHRFLFGDSGATLSDGSTYSIWGRQMAGNAKSKVTEEATAGSTTGNEEEEEQQQ